MSFDPKAVANYFLSLAKAKGESLSPMKLQKLVYYAHGFYLALTGQPLIDEQVEAWRFGPVIPSLYRAFSHYGNQPITEPAYHLVTVGSPATIDEIEFEEAIPTLDDQSDETDEARRVLDRVWDVFGRYSAVQLSNATHQPGTPWYRVNEHYHGRIPRGTDIPSDWIEEHFRARLQPKVEA